MTKLDKLARMAAQERAEHELTAALTHLRAAATILEGDPLKTMAECAIVQTEALKKEIADAS
jgi:hypothetical protein